MNRPAEGTLAMQESTVGHPDALRQTPAAPTHPAKIQDIERLRGIAIASVIFCHLSLSSVLFTKMHLDPSRMPFFLGVELFFVISGFVVTKSFASKGYSLKLFYMRRLFRIIPLVLFFITLTALLNLFHTPFAATWKIFSYNALAIFAFFLTLSSDGLYANGAMWTLSVEEQFYLIFPLLTVILVKLNLLSPRRGLVIMGFIAAAIAIVLRPMIAIYGFSEKLPFILIYLANLKFDFLCIGVTLYFACALRRTTFASTPRWQLRTALTISLITPFIVEWLCGGGGLSSPQDAWQFYTFGLAICGASFAVTVWLSSLNLNLVTLHPWVDRCLDYLGSRSYTLYVLHFPIFIVAWMVINKCVSWIFYINPIWYSLAQLFLTAIIGIPLVEFSYRLIERPMIAYGYRLTGRTEPDLSKR